MKRCPKCNEVKESVEFAKDKSRSDGLTSQCKVCRRAAFQKWYSENAGYEAAKSAERWAANREALCARMRALRAERREERNARQRAFTAAHPGHNTVHHARWARKNRAVMTAAQVERKARLTHQTPAWFDAAEVGAVYAFCQAWSKATGVPHHVDHIVPLKGSVVRGFHVADNLRILPARDNQRKGNRTWPDEVARPAAMGA